MERLNTPELNTPKLDVPELNVTALGHSFGPEEVLKDISFTLKKGQVVSVVGPSGGGKTTLLHLCAGLLEVEEGAVENSFSSFAFTFQDARLLPWQTTLDNIAYGLKARAIPKKIRLDMARKIAVKFGLDPDDLLKFPKDLSGGMKQRAAFARALVLKPEILFLDEPFSALDIGLKQELQQILIKQIIEDELSILFITHDLIEAVRLSHHIILLGIEPGRIMHNFYIDRPLDQRDDLFIHQETARLLSHDQIIKTFEIKMV